MTCSTFMCRYTSTSSVLVALPIESRRCRADASPRRSTRDPRLRRRRRRWHHRQMNATRLMCGRRRDRAHRASRTDSNYCSREGQLASGPRRARARGRCGSYPSISRLRQCSPRRRRRSHPPRSPSSALELDTAFETRRHPVAATARPASERSKRSVQDERVIVPRKQRRLQAHRLREPLKEPLNPPKLQEELLDIRLREGNTVLYIIFLFN